MKKTVSLSLKITPELERKIEKMVNQKSKTFNCSKNWLCTKYIVDGLERDTQANRVKTTALTRAAEQIKTHRKLLGHEND